MRTTVHRCPNWVVVTTVVNCRIRRSSELCVMWFSNLSKNREQTSGLEPLTCSLRVCGRRLERGALQYASVGWEALRRTKAIDRIRHRLPRAVQKGILYRTARAAHLSPLLSSRNLCSVEGEWFW